MIYVAKEMGQGTHNMNQSCTLMMQQIGIMAMEYQKDFKEYTKWASEEMVGHFQNLIKLSKAACASSEGSIDSKIVGNPVEVIRLDDLRKEIEVDTLSKSIERIGDQLQSAFRNVTEWIYNNSENRVRQ